MAKKPKRTNDGHKNHAHGPLCALMGCTKKTKGKIHTTHEKQVPDDQLLPGWERGNNWSVSRRNQFPHGVPKEYGE